MMVSTEDLIEQAADFWHSTKPGTLHEPPSLLWSRVDRQTDGTYIVVLACARETLATLHYDPSTSTFSNMTDWATTTS